MNRMGALDAFRAREREIRSIAARHGAGNIRVFGSVAPDSDVDFLIDIVGPTTPWFPGGHLAELEEALGRRVDIVIARSVGPLIRDSVFQESVPLFAD